MHEDTMFKTYKMYFFLKFVLLFSFIVSGVKIVFIEIYNNTISLSDLFFPYIYLQYFIQYQKNMLGNNFQ